MYVELVDYCAFQTVIGIFVTCSFVATFTR